MAETSSAKRHVVTISLVVVPLLVIGTIVSIAVGYSSHHHGTTLTTLPSSAPANGHDPHCITLEADAESVTTAVLSYANTTGSTSDALNSLSRINADLHAATSTATGTSLAFLHKMEYLVASVESAISADDVTGFQTQWSQLTSLMHNIKTTC